MVEIVVIIIVKRCMEQLMVARNLDSKKGKKKGGELEGKLVIMIST